MKFIVSILTKKYQERCIMLLTMACLLTIKQKEAEIVSIIFKDDFLMGSGCVKLIETTINHFFLVFEQRGNVFFEGK